MVPRSDISKRRQCVLLGLNPSSLYYQPVGEKPENLEIMRQMDEEFLEHPTKGVKGMVDLSGTGHQGETWRVFHFCYPKYVNELFYL